MELHASYYTPVIDSKAIPTGELAKVAGTPFDFREMKEIGRDIEADDTQLHYAGGYDHNYALDKADGTMQLAARARGAKVRHLHGCVYTDCVGSSSIPATLSRRRPARAVCSTASAMHSV